MTNSENRWFIHANDDWTEQNIFERKRVEGNHHNEHHEGLMTTHSEKPIRAWECSFNFIADIILRFTENLIQTQS